ncbi:hypothetical protein, partial [Bacillus haynesii]|uniref:hypothetical protein n=1 Tax=Bacillus haynesii TaxID=1925021 RepID=UPI001F601FF1
LRQMQTGTLILNENDDRTKEKDIGQQSYYFFVNIKKNKIFLSRHILYQVYCIIKNSGYK